MKWNKVTMIMKKIDSEKSKIYTNLPIILRSILGNKLFHFCRIRNLLVIDNCNTNNVKLHEFGMNSSRLSNNNCRNIK